MKIKENYALRQIAGTWAVLPLGAATLNFNGILTLNESGVMLWKLLEQGSDRASLVEALLAEYEVSAEEAAEDADEFVNKLATAGCLEL